MPAWCSPWNACRSTACAASPSVARAVPIPPANPAAPTAAARSGVPEEAAPGDAVGRCCGTVGHQSVTAAVSLESGSDSALTASESALTSGLLRRV